MTDAEDKQSNEVSIAKRLNELVIEGEQDLFNRVYQINTDSTDKYLTESAEEWNRFKQQYLRDNGERVGDSFLTYKNLNTVTGWIVGGGIGFLSGVLLMSGFQGEAQAAQESYAINPELITTITKGISTLALGYVTSSIAEHVSPHFFTRKIKKEYSDK